MRIKKNIGILAPYLDLRNDIRFLIKKISINHNVYVFVTENKKLEIKGFFNNSVKKVLINKEYKKSFFKYLLNFFFKYFGNLPTSTEGIYLSRYRNIFSKNQNFFIKIIKILFLKIKFIIPRFISYDKYLEILTPSNNELSQIDKFIFFSPLIDHEIISEIIKKKISFYIYIYSWDHPHKFNHFIKQSMYFVWSEGIKNDLIKLHNIHSRNINVIGSTQLSLVEEYKNLNLLKKNKPKNKFIYYICFSGYKEIVDLEIKLIKLISEMIELQSMDVKLIVRPYPQIYSYDDFKLSIDDIPNVILEKKFWSDSNLSVTKNEIYKKFSNIDNSIILLHIGTTVGLESIFLDKPSYVLSPSDILKTSDIITKNLSSIQPHIKKYLLGKNKENLIDSRKKLFQLISKQKHDFDFNYIRNNFPLFPLDLISKKILVFLDNE